MGARALLPASPCVKLHELLGWMAIAGQLKRLHQREISSAGGPEPYAPLGVFKLMLLGQWHGLSGAQLEHTLTVGYTLADPIGLEGGWSRFGFESTRGNASRANASEGLPRHGNRHPSLGKSTYCVISECSAEHPKSMSTCEIDKPLREFICKIVDWPPMIANSLPRDSPP